MAKIFKAGFYYVEDTQVNGLLRVKGPGLSGFAGDVRNKQMLCELAICFDGAYEAGRVSAKPECHKSFDIGGQGIGGSGRGPGG